MPRLISGYFSEFTFPAGRYCAMRVTQAWGESSVARKRMISPGRCGDSSSPARVWLMSKFWQNAQRRLHQAKKMVPLPFQPRRQPS